MFDWINFLQRRGIAFATRGKNVAKGNLVVHCPFCGPEDEGHHMEISTKGRGWKCLRRGREHRGKNPIKLIMALVGCNYATAANVVGDTTFIPDDFMAAVTKHVNGWEPPHPARALTMPEEFLPVGANRPSARLFNAYLAQRGFDDLDLLATCYGIRYCSRGPFKGRIIFPIHHDGKLVNWTGRTVYPKESEDGIRYRTLSTDSGNEMPGAPTAIGPVTDYLLWYDELRNNIDPGRFDTIVLVEGPFDALRVDVLGYEDGIRSTCFFTAQPSIRQIDLFHEIMPRFKRRFLLLDRNTTATAIRVSAELKMLNVETRQVPDNVKDPGEISSTGQLLKILD